MLIKSKYLLLLLFLINSQVMADTHYVATSGSNSSSCTSPSSPCLTLNYAISKMTGGDTLEIANGTYSGTANNLDKNSNIPPGTDAKYTIIKAANIDSTTSHVTITSAFYFQVNSSEANRLIHHVEFHGLKIKNTKNKNISGHHIKVFKTGFEGGPSTRNNIVFSVGQNNLSATSNNILLEDVWSYGRGGRYNIMVFNSYNVIVRRAVIRHDGGWGCDGSNPEAGMVIYNSRNVQLQNVIVLDSIFDNNTAGGRCQGRLGFYNVSNNAGTTKHANTRTVGSISLNNATNVGIAWDDSKSIPNALLENSVIFNSGKGVNANGTYKDITMRNVTIASNSSHGVAKYGTNNTFRISNTLIYNNGGDALKNITGRSNVLCYSNAVNSGCSITNINPTTNGLIHLPRIESGSYLETAGSGSSRIGANIINRTGVSGTLYGQANYDTEQDSLWPWPNQSRITSDMCSVRSDGFCAATSLTDYIWSALGNSTPANMQSMVIPTGIRIKKRP